MQSNEGKYIALDIGGTKLMAAVVGGDGALLEREGPVATPEGVEDGLEVLHGMVERLVAGRKVAGIGAAIGGPLDWRTGVVSPLHQAKWRNVPLKAIMEQRWGCPFHLDIDTNVAALAEYDAAPDKPDRLIYLTISTGMGGGVMLDGRLYRGAGGAHPEAAHQGIAFRCAHPERVQCECGAPDCLEALVSGNGIRRIYGKPAEELDGAEWDEVGYNLGLGLRNLAALWAPGVIVLGGAIPLRADARFLHRARATMEERLRIVPAPEIRLSRLGYDTALVGAGLLARRGVEA